jgi:hypothetical protein
MDRVMRSDDGLPPSLLRDESIASMVFVPDVRTLWTKDQKTCYYCLTQFVSLQCHLLDHTNSLHRPILFALNLLHNSAPYNCSHVQLDMFDNRASEKPAATIDSDHSHDGSQDALDNVEGELTSARLLTTVLALVLSIFLVSVTP